MEIVMHRVPALCLSFAVSIATAVSVFSTPARAAGEDAARFMERFSGEWRGTGKLLIGPDSGMKFHCTLKGNPSRTQMTFGMSGKCWAGRLSAPVFARLRYNHETNRFYGDFMDGAEGDGVDIVAESAGEGFSMWLSRGQLQGELVASPAGSSKMTILMSLIDQKNDRKIPVVAMGFAREGADSLPVYDPVITGALKKNGN